MANIGVPAGPKTLKIFYNFSDNQTFLHTTSGFYMIHFNKKEIEEIVKGYIPNIYKKEEFFYFKYPRSLVVFDIYNMRCIKAKPDLIHNAFEMQKLQGPINHDFSYNPHIERFGLYTSPLRLAAIPILHESRMIPVKGFLCDAKHMAYKEIREEVVHDDGKKEVHHKLVTLTSDNELLTYNLETARLEKKKKVIDFPSEMHPDIDDRFKDRCLIENTNNQKKRYNMMRIGSPDKMSLLLNCDIPYLAPGNMHYFADDFRRLLILMKNSKMFFYKWDDF